MHHLLVGLGDFRLNAFEMNQYALQGIGILVVEDEDVLRTTTGIFLRERGAHVLEASNGGDALHQFLHNQDTVDLIFTDIKMPKVNGFELFRHIQNIRAGKKVIFTSGFEVPESERSIVPPEIFIAKPFRGKQLISKVLDVLKHDFHGLLKQELPGYDFDFLKPSKHDSMIKQVQIPARLSKVFPLESNAG